MLLIFCAVLGVVTILGLISNLTPNNVVLLRTNAGTVKLELTDDVNMSSDTTMEEFNKKLKVTTTKIDGKLGALVKVTSQGLMFDYTINNTKYYFKANKGKLNTIDAETFKTTLGSASTATSAGLEDFRDNINTGTKFEKFKLNGDIDLNNQEWEPIGITKTTTNGSYVSAASTTDNSFTGTFDGGGFTISNFKITS